MGHGLGCRVSGHVATPFFATVSGKSRTRRSQSNLRAGRPNIPPATEITGLRRAGQASVPGKIFSCVAICRTVTDCHTSRRLFPLRALSFSRPVRAHRVGTNLALVSWIPEQRQSRMSRRTATFFAQFIGLCSSSKWSRHLTKSPFLARLAMAGSNAAYKIISACSNAVN
jgi:hypothetical protein